VLLGLEPDAPLLTCEGMVSRQDKEEVAALLQTVISYWSVLKNTSIDGFRSSFLVRPGLLREEEGWRLSVERKPFDMLLDHLPWSLSIIRLPWMKRVLYTEW
jgi:hypothetical protein